MIERLKFVEKCESFGFAATRHFFGESHQDLIDAGYVIPGEYIVHGRFLYLCLWLTDEGRITLLSHALGWL